ncbi:MAG: hypothetical protein KatS3mg027_0116 [Bacteroidia bacterium]|nr:MAG: hypothetical protein KatS3mg027_0116 [Bacteroidia bacterium]
MEGVFDIVEVRKVKANYREIIEKMKGLYKIIVEGIIRNIIVLGFLWVSSFAQTNLIVNPSFEEHECVPQTMNISPSLLNFNCCENWEPLFVTPDYFSSFSPFYTGCIFPTLSVNVPQNIMGYQPSKDGNFYVGMLLFVDTIAFPQLNGFYTEAIKGKLVSPLLPNHVYEFTLYWSLANGCHSASNQLQVYFTPYEVQWTYHLDSIPYFFPYNYPSQVSWDSTQYMTDTLNWVKMSGCFIAQGGEKHINIGKFRRSNPTTFIQMMGDNTFYCRSSCNEDNLFYAYYFMDDLSLYDRGYYSGSARCIKDTTICPNSTLLIGANIPDSAQYEWTPAVSLSCSNCPNPIASPSVTTTYILKKQLCSFISYDTVTIRVVPYPSPANAGNDTSICWSMYSKIGVAEEDYPFTTYNWAPSDYLSCTACSQTDILPLENDTTLMYVLTQTFCDSVSRDTLRLRVVLCEEVMELPNVFTPNGDGINDSWHIVWKEIPIGIKDFKVEIYDRWGLKVYESDRWDFKWDGKHCRNVKLEVLEEECTTGTYYYIIQYDWNGKEREWKGYLTLLR